MRGFEPLTPCSRSRCATRLRYTPTPGNALSHRDFGHASAIPGPQQIRTKRTRSGFCPGTVLDKPGSVRSCSRNCVYRTALGMRSRSSRSARRFAADCEPRWLAQSKATRKTTGLLKRRRKIDLRRIRGRVCYSVAEAATLLLVSEGTIRAWLRAGLPALDRNRPMFIPGADLKVWLQNARSVGHINAGPTSCSAFDAEGQVPCDHIQRNSSRKSEKAHDPRQMLYLRHYHAQSRVADEYGRSQISALSCRGVKETQ